MGQGLHLLTPSGALSLWLRRLSHTHKPPDKTCWKDGGSGSHSETSDPSDWCCQLFQFGGRG